MADKTPGAQAVQDALGVLEGRALFDGDQHDVHVRIAAHRDGIYVDLADEQWRAVEITPGGWQVVEPPAVRFRRTRGMLALPAPERGGTIDELREFLNHGTEDDFRLMGAWLVMAIRARGPYPVLALHGEQGSAKSTIAAVLRTLIDPNARCSGPCPAANRIS